MIFYFDKNGQPLKTAPDTIVQTSVDANTVYFCAPFAATNAVTVKFTLPNGKVILPLYMTQMGQIAGVKSLNGEAFAMWGYTLNADITRYTGKLTMQFTIYNGSARITTITSVVNIAPGVAQSLPSSDEVSEDFWSVYDQIYQAFSQMLGIVYDTNGTGGLEYYVTDEKAYVTGLSEEVDTTEIHDLIIPPFYLSDGGTNHGDAGKYYPVVGIWGAFNLPACTNVKLPETITTIGYDGENDYPVFVDCPLLDKITLPASVQHIGAGAFAGAFAGTMVDYLTITFLGAPPTYHGSFIENGTSEAEHSAMLYVNIKYFDAWKSFFDTNGSLTSEYDAYTTIFYGVLEDYSYYALLALAGIDETLLYAKEVGTLDNRVTVHSTNLIEAFFDLGSSAKLSTYADGRPRYFLNTQTPVLIDDIFAVIWTSGADIKYRLFDLRENAEYSGTAGANTTFYSIMSSSANKKVYATTADLTAAITALQSSIADNYYTKVQTDSKLAGKQNVIDGSNKLPSNFVDDTNQTHKFVTAEQRTQITTNATNIAEIQEAIPSGAGSDDKLVKTSELNGVSSDLSAVEGRVSDIEDLIPADTSAADGNTLVNQAQLSQVANNIETAYVIDIAHNSAFAATGNVIYLALNATIKTIDNETIAVSDLAKGNLILITDTGYPDRFFGGEADDNGVTKYAFIAEETAVDLSGYATLADLAGKVDIISVTATTTMGDLAGKVGIFDLGTTTPHSYYLGIVKPIANGKRAFELLTLGDSGYRYYGSATADTLFTGVLTATYRKDFADKTTVNNAITSLTERAENGEFPANEARTAQNLINRDNSSVHAYFTRRISGGNADIGTGTAKIKKWYGSMIRWEVLRGDSNNPVSRNDPYIMWITYINGEYVKQTNFTLSSEDDFAVCLIGLGITTVDEFLALYPGNWGATDGGVLAQQGLNEGIKTIGFNLYNPTTEEAALFGGKQYQITVENGEIFQVVYTDKNGTGSVTLDENGYFTPTNDGTLKVIANGDVCVHLVASGYKDYAYAPYWESLAEFPDVSQIQYGGSSLFPEGLLSVGSYKDYVTRTTAYKAIGKVDLGSLDWTDNGDGSFTTTNVIADMVNTTFNICMCAKYPSLYSFSSSPQIRGSSRKIRIKDSSLTAANINDELSGVYAYYPLATPITVTLDTPLNLPNYKVDDFGVEAAGTGEVPLDFDVYYELNAVDVVRNLPPRVTDLENNKVDIITIYGNDTLLDIVGAAAGHVGGIFALSGTLYLGEISTYGNNLATFQLECLSNSERFVGSNVSNTLTIFNIVYTSLYMADYATRDKVPLYQTTFAIARDELTNINGQTRAGYTATLTTIDGHSVYQIQYGAENISKSRAINYLKFMTGSEFVPTYNANTPQNTIIMFADGTFWKPQYDDTNGLLLYAMSSPLALASDVTAIQNVIPSTASSSNKLVTESDVTLPVITITNIDGYGTGAFYGNQWIRLNLGANNAVLTNDKYTTIKLDVTAIKSYLGGITDYIYIKRNVVNSSQNITLIQFFVDDAGFDYSHITDAQNPYVQIMQIGDGALIYEPTSGYAWLTNRNINPTDIYSRLNPAATASDEGKIPYVDSTGAYQLRDLNKIYRHNVKLRYDGNFTIYLTMLNQRAEAYTLNTFCSDLSSVSYLPVSGYWRDGADNIGCINITYNSSNNSLTVNGWKPGGSNYNDKQKVYSSFTSISEVTVDDDVVQLI